MMKNKKLKIFVYLSVILGFLVSCRTDFVNEQIAKKSNASSLTTKRISLQESSHRQRLTPILSELKKNINIDNTFGKSVNFGDSITINTDDIILMENGTNFHTYTFRINRNNSSTNAPIENLLLIPKSDGSYEGYMIVFNLNEQEKQKILNNEKLDLRNKTIITKFENNGIFNLFSKACIPTYINIAVRCGGEEGHMSGLPCPHAGTNLAAYWTYVLVYDCFDTANDIKENINPSEPNTGGGAFPCPDCPAPEPCVQVPTSPTPSTTITDENGCVVGLPTTPNMGIEATTCKKIKNTINKPQIKDTIASYKTFAQVSKKKEKGFMEYTNGTLISGQVSKDLSVTHVYGFTSVGTIHVHPLESIAIFSPKDLLNFITLLKYQNPTSIKNAYAGMISSTGNYYINFSGTASDLPPDLTQQEYVIYIQDLYNKYYAIFNNIRKSENKPMGNNLSQQGREKLFFEMMKHMGLKGKINLVKEENGTLYNISEGLNGNPPTSTPCN